MIVEASKNHHQMECPAVAVQGEKRKCPFATDLSNSGTETKPVSSASFVVPPHPPGWRSYPILGHAPQLFKMGEKGEMAPAMLKAFKMSPGDMSSLDIPGMSEGNRGVYFTSNADYAHIVSTDLEHWGKITHQDTRGPFYMARQVIGDSLFVASDTEPNWGKAHRILMPAFSPSGLKTLADITLTKVDHLLERFASTSKEPFEIGDAFTSLTFDVIGNYIASLDFGTTEDPKKLETDRILVALDEAMRSRENAQKPFNGRLDYKMYKRRMEAYQTLHDSATEVIHDRLSGKTSSQGGQPDVLDRMLNTVDPETNEKMDLTLIRNHLILFLLVGHDSTSSLLTSLIYVLSQHPDVEDKIRQEVESVIRNGVPTMENIKKLTYTMAVIKETLRLFPPAVALGKTCLKDTSLGPWKIRKGSRLIVIVKEVHKNQKYWGDNPEEFDPSRFLPNSPIEQKHDYAWLPFSSGPRGCIGMQFSLIEARIILARMMPRFTFRLHKDAEVKEGFRTFMKLSNVYVTAHRIPKNTPTDSRRPAAEAETLPHKVLAEFNRIEPTIESHNGRIDIYFGSNTGTCENYSHRLCSNAKNLRFDTTVAPLDDLALKGFDADSLTVIVTSTYNSQPPNNGKKFSEYCQNIKPNSLSGIKVAILGIGNSNWKSFQAFPSYIETALRTGGADILGKRGVADEEGDMQGDLRQWADFEFWPSVLESAGLDPNSRSSANTDMKKDLNQDSVAIRITDSDKTSLHHLRSSENQLVTVVTSRELQCPDSGRSTKHIEFKLPKTLEYEAGDHLAVFPQNDPQVVLAFGSLIREENLGRVVVLNAHGVCDASYSSFSCSHLPLGVPITVFDLLSKFLDLQAPATPSFVSASCTCAKDPNEREALQEILDLLSNPTSNSPNWQELRPIQVLQAFPSVRMNLETVLLTISPMKKRYYSISSSPFAQHSNLSITVGLVEGTTTTKPVVSPSGQPYVSLSTLEHSEAYCGVSSGYLANLRLGQLVEVSLEKNERFRLPKCPRTPVIMIGPGTGIAPFRGFLQEIKSQVDKQQLPRREGVLFFGCRNEKDFLYRSELLESSSKSGVEVHVAFSRPIRGQGRYVQDLLWENRGHVWELLTKQGAHLYICGDGRRMAKDVDQMMYKIAVEATGETGACFLEDLQKQGRYLQDVWCNSVASGSQ